MKSPITILALMGVAALALVLVACEDSELTAPVDGQIVVTANPATVVLDPDQGITSGQSTITATVFDSEGRSAQNVSVLFAVTGGGGTITPTSAKTDSSGKAQTVLTLKDSDPAGTQVTAQSSSLSADVQIEKINLDPNELPTAGVVVSPAMGQLVGGNVLFDGSISSDPDGEIRCYQWSVNSTIDSEDEIVQGVAASAIERSYSSEQVLDVILRVADDTTLGGAQCLDSPPNPPLAQNRFSPIIGKIEKYEISCSNPAPVADAGPDQMEGAGRTVSLDGRGSTDDRGPGQLTYTWDCGSGAKPFPDPQFPDGSVVNCQYFVAGTYVATLRVTDEGDGTIDPMTGTFRCQKSSTDEATVTIVP